MDEEEREKPEFQINYVLQLHVLVGNYRCHRFVANRHNASNILYMMSEVGEENNKMKKDEKDEEVSRIKKASVLEIHFTPTSGAPSPSPLHLFFSTHPVLHVPSLAQCDVLLSALRSRV